MEDSQKLGEVSLHFTDEGNLIGVSFTNCDLINTLDTIKLHPTTDVNYVCEVAKKSIANLFTLVNNIEMADREKYKVSSVPLNVVRNQEGIIKEATIAFSLEKL
jgi:hypothetical protein